MSIRVRSSLVAVLALAASTARAGDAEDGVAAVAPPSGAATVPAPRDARAAPPAAPGGTDRANRAQEAEVPDAPDAADEPDASNPADPDEADRTDEPVAARRWEGAIGLLASWGASHHGRGRPDFGVEPGFFLRYGRLSISNAGAFATRRSDDVLRGLGLDLARRDRLRVNVSLRYDRGRDDDDDALRGLGEVRATLRARVGASWRLDGGWRVSGGWSPDLLGRGGGSLVDAGVSRERPLSPQTRWNAGLRLSAADARYMRSYYGVTPGQAAASGYPVYEPGAGLRDLQASIGLRHDLSSRWVLLGGVSVRRLLGPAADGPAVTDRFAWSVGGGVGWRF